MLLNDAHSVYRGEDRLTGVLFMHPINNNKFSHTADRISNILDSLYDCNAMNQLTLCTTMWDTVPEDEGYDRLDDLCETDAWNKMISTGAGTAMIYSISPNAQAEAERIVGELIKNVQPVELAIQDETLNQVKTEAQTAAGQKARVEEERKMRALRESVRRDRAR